MVDLSKTTIRNLLAAVLTAIFSITLFDAVFHISTLINPGVSNIYNALGKSREYEIYYIIIPPFKDRKHPS